MLDEVVGALTSHTSSYVGVSKFVHGNFSVFNEVSNPEEILRKLHSDHSEKIKLGLEFRKKFYAQLFDDLLKAPKNSAIVEEYKALLNSLRMAKTQVPSQMKDEVAQRRAREQMQIEYPELLLNSFEYQTIFGRTLWKISQQEDFLRKQNQFGTSKKEILERIAHLRSKLYLEALKDEVFAGIDELGKKMSHVLVDTSAPWKQRIDTVPLTKELLIGLTLDWRNLTVYHSSYPGQKFLLERVRSNRLGSGLGIMEFGSAFRESEEHLLRGGLAGFNATLRTHLFYEISGDLECGHLTGQKSVTI